VSLRRKMPVVTNESLAKFALVAARYNAVIVDALLAGALDAFRRQGAAEDRVDVVQVPGSFELPLVAQEMAKTGKYAAVVCLGCVIRGDTDHYEYVCRAAADGILQAGLTTGVPVIFGVLTCETMDQAVDRAGGSAGNKGAESALTAIEMAGLLAKIRT
jgi:6,7-dimethyl-8-ribityllumazine synthase